MTTTPDDTTTDHIAIDRVTAHPDNVRRHLGDLDELVRSIKTHGVLQPLLVLPADNNGTHLIVAGHRRHAAASAAGLSHVPVVIRDLDRRSVIEAMLIENGNRDSLSVRDEVEAIAKLITIDTAVTPAKLCKRIGKSQRWVRDRMAITVLPTQWLDKLSNGDLTLAQAVAASGCADLGPDHIEGVCTELADSGRWDHDPARTVERYRRRIKLDADEAAAIAKCDKSQIAYFTASNPPPNSARSITALGLDERAHRGEPCHAVYIRRDSWSDRLSQTTYCTAPKRHRQPGAETTSTGAARAEQDRHDDSRVKRRSRLARLAAGTELFARRGGPASSELMVLALHSYIDHASHDAAKFAATMLGLDTDRPFQALAAHAATRAAGLAQAAGAIACGTAEIEAYHSTRHGVLAWYGLLTNHGWEPDDWTAGRLALAAERPPDDEQPAPAEAEAEMADGSDEGDVDTGGDRPADGDDTDQGD